MGNSCLSIKLQVNSSGTVPFYMLLTNCQTNLVPIAKYCITENKQHLHERIPHRKNGPDRIQPTTLVDCKINNGWESTAPARGKDYRCHVPLHSK